MTSVSVHLLDSEPVADLMLCVHATSRETLDRARRADPSIRTFEGHFPLG